MEVSMQKRWLSTEEAAIYLNCSKSFLNHDRVTGIHKIPFTRFGRKILYDLEQLNKYLEERLQQWDCK